MAGEPFRARPRMPTSVLRGEELCDLAGPVRPPTLWMGSVSSIAELRADPERLLTSATGQQELELALLASLRTLPVPPGAKGLVWNALGVQVIGTGVTAVANPGSWATAFWRSTLKVLVTSKAAVAVPVVMAALGAGALQYQKSVARQSPSADHAPSQQAASGSAAAPSADSTESSAADSESADSPDLAVSEPPTRAAPLAPARDRLREESALLERARALLRGGHPRAAQATLLRLQAQFPKGALTQEREVLLIEALAARGKAEAAARDARSFVAAHPESPHAIQLRHFIDRPN